MQGVPWVARELQIPPTLVNQHLLLRAKEEKAIIQREARDATVYYSYFINECARASAECEQQLTQAEGDALELLLSTRFLPGAVHFKYARSSQVRLLQQLLRGKQVMLSEKKVWYEGRLDEMRGLNVWLHERESAVHMVSAPEGGSGLAPESHLAEVDGGMLEALEEAAQGGIASLVGEELGLAEADE